MLTKNLSRDMITVLHNCNNWLPITENWLYNQIRYLPNSVESHIVCETTANLEEFWLPNIHCLPELPHWRFLLDKGLCRLGVLRRLSLLAEVAKQHEANVLHSHFGHDAWFNMRVAKRTGLGHVVTFYGYDVNYIPTQDPRWYKRYRALFEHVDRVLCEGSHMAKCIVQMGCPEYKVQVHHLGIGIENILFKPRQWQPSEPLRILIAASFREKKGIPYALEALGKLQYQVPFEVTIIGDATSNKETQAEKARILATIAKYQLQSKVRFLGFQPPAILFEEAYKHHIFLSPSVTASSGDTEGGAPVCLIEMAATGMPIVSTTHCDIPEVIINGVTGLLAEERDIDGLVTHLQNLINSSEQWIGMLQAARSHIEREYNAKMQASKLAAIYMDVHETHRN